MDLREITEKIDSLSEELDKLRPLKPEDEQRVMQKFRLDWNYNSNNIEGNSLTYGETKALILFGITAQGKPLKDHLEIEGHNEAIDYIGNVARGNEPLTEVLIRNLHKMILHEPYELKAKTVEGKLTTKKIEIGKYKSTPNHIETVTGEIFRFASPEETPAKMEELMKWYRENLDNNKYHPLLFAVEFHYRFIRIHPFDDGNGRIVRLLLNLIFMQKKLPPVIVKVGDKEEYYRALQQADSGNMESFYSFIGRELIRSLELMINAAKGNAIEEPDDVDKKIKILQSKIENLNKPEIREEKNSGNVIRVFELSIVPFLKNIFNKLKTIDKNFKETKILCVINDSLVPFEKKGALDGILEFIKNNKPENIQNFGIHYNLNAFKKTGVNDFNVSVYLHFNFEKYKYVLILDFKNYEKLLNEIYSIEDINRFTGIVVDEALKQIETGIKKSQ